MSQTKAQLVSGLNLNPSAPATALQIDASGNINLDSNTLYVDATNNRVGLGTSSPSSALDVAGAISLGAVALPSAGTARIFSRNTDSNLYIQTGSGNTLNLLDVSQNTMASFGASTITLQTGNSPRLTIDSSGRVGIGSTAAPGKLTVATTSADPVASLSAWTDGYSLVSPGGTSTSGGIGFSFNTTTNIGHISCATPGTAWRDLIYQAITHRFMNGGSELVRIDSSGRLLVGLTSATGATNGKAVFGTGNNNSTDGIVIINTENKNTSSLVLSNWTGVAATQGPRITFDNSGVGSWVCGAASGVDAFDIAKTWGTPLVRLDTSGRLLVGLNSTQAGAGASDKLQVSGAVNIVSSTNIYSRLVAGGGGLTITSNAYPANVGTTQSIIMSIGTAGGGGPTQFMRLLSTGYHRIGGNADTTSMGIDYPLEIVSSSSAGTQGGLASYYGLITGASGAMNQGADNDNTVGVSFELSTHNIGGWRPATIMLHVARGKGDATLSAGAWYLYSFITYNGGAGTFSLQDSGGSTGLFTISAVGTTGSWDSGTKQSVIVRFSVNSGSFSDAYTTIYAELNSYNSVIRSQRESA